MIKAITDNLVILIVCWISIVLAVFEGSYISKYFSDGWLIPGFVIMFCINVGVLMWLWSRFGPTRSRKTEQQTDD